MKVHCFEVKKKFEKFYQIMGKNLLLTLGKSINRILVVKLSMNKATNLS